MQLFGFGCADEWAEVQFGQWTVRSGHSERVSESDGLHHRQVHVEEGVDQIPLYDKARVRRAPLLAVLEALTDVCGERVPLGEIPDAPSVQALLLDHVALVGVEEGRSNLATVGAATDERHRADLGCPYEDLGEFLAATGQQRRGQSGAGHQRVRDGEAQRAAL